MAIPKVGIKHKSTDPKLNVTLLDLKNKINELISKNFLPTEDFDILKLANVPWIDVRKYGAVADELGDGSGTDNTSAFQNAIIAAEAINGEIFIPMGRYLIAGELSITKAIKIRGSRRGRMANNIEGAIIYFNNSDSAKGLFRFTGTLYAIASTSFEDFEIIHLDNPVNQHSIIFDGRGAHGLILRRLSFKDCTGYAIYFIGDCYLQNIDFSNLSFWNVGGLIGWDGTSSTGLLVTLAEIRNINLDVGVNQTSPQSPLVDLTAFREIHLSTILLEGADANVASGGIGIQLGGDAYNVLDGYHEEFVGAGFTNGIKIVTPTYPTATPQPLGLYDLRNLHTRTPIKVTAEKAQIFIRGQGFWEPSTLADIIDIDAGSDANVIFDGFQTKWLEPLIVPDTLLHKIEFRNVKGLVGNEKIAVNFESSKEVFHWSAKDGDPLKAITEWANITDASGTIASKGIVDDTDVGYVYEMVGTVNEMPRININVTPPSHWASVQIVIAMRYKVVSADTGATPHVLYIGSEGADYLHTRLNESELDAWKTAYLIVNRYDDDNLITVYSRRIGTPDANYTLRIAEISVSIGKNLPVLLGNVKEMDFVEGSLVWDPGNLVDGTGETSGDITVTGAVVTDRVEVFPPYSLQAILCMGYVSATNTVNIRLQNETGGAINLASGTWNVKVIKAY